MDRSTGSGVDGLSRRDLFGAGLGRVFDARVAAAQAATRARRPAGDVAPAAPEPFSWAEGSRQPGALGNLVAPAARRLVEAARVGPGSRVLDASAGDGLLVELAARAGADVIACEPDAALRARGQEHCSAPTVEWCEAWPTGSATGGRIDAVLSCFGASHRADTRSVAAELVQAADSGARIGLTAWSGLMSRVLTAAAPDRPGRTERWCRYETARLHFFDFPELAVDDHWMDWRFADEEQATAMLASPVAGRRHARRVVRA